MTLPISVFIITHNEADRIAATIQAVSGLVREIVIVDSGSRDGTRQIARDLGADVFSNAFEGYGQQKRYAEDQCTSEWLFNLDADEVVTADLAAELRDRFADPSQAPCAFRVRILNVYPGESKPRWLANDYNIVRLYHRDAGRYRDHSTYDRVVLNPNIATVQLRHPVYHHPIVDWHQMADKGNRFSSHHLEKAETRNAALLRARMFIEFPWAFLRAYIGRRHITGGWKGFMFALNSAFMRTLRIAKMLEVIENRRQDVPRS